MTPMFKVFMADTVAGAVKEVLESGMVGEGPKVAEFKRQLEEKFKVKNMVMLNSCTSALTLALRLAGVRPGDEVISTPFTMIATNCAIANFGARIVWADVEDDSCNISMDSVFSKLSPKTKAIVVTHVGGDPVKINQLDFGVPVIADAAHAVNSYIQGEHISHFGDYVCFSFQAIKQLNTGDGGALVVRDDSKYELADKLKWFGMTRKVPEGMTRLQHQMTADVFHWGYKFHMNDIAAAIGIENLKHLDRISHEHHWHAEYYREHLGMPVVAGSCSWVFGIRVNRRDEVISLLAEAGYESTPMWKRNDRYSCFKGEETSLPNLDRLEKEILFIPVGWWVTEDELEKIVNIVKPYENHYRN